MRDYKLNDTGVAYKAYLCKVNRMLSCYLGI